MLSLLGNRVKRFRNTPQIKLTDSAGAGADLFGYSVALSANGNTALVGAYGDDVGANFQQGSAIVFTRSGTTWTEQAKLTDSVGDGADSFGYSVALSSDGNTALIGVYADTVGANTQQGSALVFTRSGSTWTQQAKLTDSTGASSDNFGYSVALSDDGNTALIGAYLDDVGGNFNQGSAVVFTRSSGVWTQQAKLTGSSGAVGDFFGESVALSSDGNTALIAARGVDVGVNTNQGAAIVFTRLGTTWTQQAKLTDSTGAANDSFGDSVALSNDGNTALIGSSNSIVGSIDKGSAVVFTRSGSTWTEQTKLTDSTGASADRFGRSVALSDNGNTALVGALLDDIGANTNQGSAVVFTRLGTTWTQQTKLTDSAGATNDNFGVSVALSDNGRIAIVGSYFDDVGANADQGSAIVFYRR